MYWYNCIVVYVDHFEIEINIWHLTTGSSGGSRAQGAASPRQLYVEISEDQQAAGRPTFCIFRSPTCQIDCQVHIFLYAQMTGVRSRRCRTERVPGWLSSPRASYDATTPDPDITPTTCQQHANVEHGNGLTDSVTRWTPNLDEIRLHTSVDLSPASVTVCRRTTWRLFAVASCASESLTYLLLQCQFRYRNQQELTRTSTETIQQTGNFSLLKSWRNFRLQSASNSISHITLQ